jgi:hypothetical protein
LNQINFKHAYNITEVWGLPKSFVLKLSILGI